MWEAAWLDLRDARAELAQLREQISKMQDVDDTECVCCKGMSELRKQLALAEAKIARVQSVRSKSQHCVLVEEIDEALAYTETE
jgi:hypothetical protein